MPAPTMGPRRGVYGWGTYAEVEAKYAPKTYAEVEALMAGLTYAEAEALMAAIEKAASMTGRR